ncbi:conserved protein of unknown function [Shewanella benthica]|uniref:Uncharacterized protein n=1 Tax=Shewanella benthica TaxID=43661 RepID=A0A330LXG2_9GAMM|nr:conserved protein of unknown function [Shewanella benthica]
MLYAAKLADKVTILGDKNSSSKPVHFLISIKIINRHINK